MLNKVTDFKIVSRQNTDSLESEVKSALGDGWTPSGPIFEYNQRLNQAMVRFGSGE